MAKNGIEYDNIETNYESQLPAVFDHESYFLQRTKAIAKNISLGMIAPFVVVSSINREWSKRAEDSPIEENMHNLSYFTGLVSNVALIYTVSQLTDSIAPSFAYIISNSI